MCAPKAPNPVATAQAQTASNRETAISQAGLNAINQVGPNGSLTYTQNGTWPDGTPKFTATTALSAAGQQLQNTNEGTAQNLATLAQQQSGRLGGLLNEPIDFSAQKDYLEGLTSGALDKRWNALAQQNETDLVNRGIRPGSAQYDNLKNQFMVNQSDAYNSANVANYNTALQSQLALRQQPLNEILALSGQSQVQSPQFTATPQTGVQGTDVAGITNSGYNQQMGQYNANQSTLGGLFSAGASLIPLFSDIRLKREIHQIGSLDSGLPVYEYRYAWDEPGTVRQGVMAQEVLEIFPDAVSVHESGFMMVDYGRIN